MARTGPQEFSLFVTRVRDLIRRAPVTCPGDLPAAQVARNLTREGVGSVIVCDDQGAPVGIVTDRDLRRKVVAEGRDPSGVSARAIMSAPLVTVAPAAFGFEAVLEMTRREIHHLVVVEDARLVGVISTYDLLQLHAAQPVALVQEIGRASTLEALAGLAARVTPLVRHLLDAGGTAYDIGQMVAELNDRLMARVLGLTGETLAAAGEAPPPVPYCWLVLGSEARREQTLRTDQDNGLVYADPPPESRQHAAAYYARFAEEAIRGLVAVGFPRCSANLMASNPEWCQPLSAWTGYFRRWLTEAWPAQVAAALIFFDLRPVGGEFPLADALLEVIRTEAPAQPTFLSVLAREAMSYEVPFTLWGRIAVERRGPQAGTLDVKRTGTQQFVGAGRVHALEFGLAEMNTIDRIRAAGQRGVYTEDEVLEIVDAYQFLMRLRLAHQLALIEQGVPPDNRIDPKRLSRTDAVLLREALRTVEHLKTRVSRRYRVGSLPGL
jgi:CBS domain-containing protein